MIYYISSHLPESGRQLLINSVTHNKKIVANSSTDIVLLSNLTVIVVAVLLTKVGRKGVNPGAERITNYIM